MAWTDHGHQISGTAVEGVRPEQTARCGGPGICRECSKDAMMYHIVAELYHERKKMDDPTADHRLSNGLVFASPHHPGVEHFKTHFAFGHLPWRLQEVSKRFAFVAQYLVDTQHDSPELTEALRKLWEAKNSAVLNAGFITEKNQRDPA